MRLRNQNGYAEWAVIGLGTIPAFMGWAYIGVVVAAVALTPSFRERKAIEKCEATQGLNHQECVDRVATWDKKTILAYIKDDAPGYTQNYTHR